jgi:hypothetical protein
MSSIARRLACIVLIVASLAAAGCDESGIGINVPASGARWSGPGPDVLVAGGPR